jgi:sigma-B regulation protein RsbU (phosphoserine phosphatase)
MPSRDWKIVRSLRALGSFLFHDLSQEEFARLFGRDAVEAFTFHLRGWDEATPQKEGVGARFLSKVGFLAARILGQLSPARRFLFVLALALVILSVFTTGNLPLWAFTILAFLLLLELTEKLLARDEIEIAREVQLSLFPQSDPALDGWRVASRNVPANEVGGDYYDYVECREGRALGLALGDVAGKGMGAALLVANLQATLRALIEARTAPASTTESSEGEDGLPSREEMERLFSRLNHALAGVVQSNRFASLVYGELDTATGRFVYVNAGQNPPLVVRSDGAVERLEPGGIVLGAFAEASFAAGELTLQPGDALALYCDGVTERFSESGEEFGDQRLVDVLVENRGHRAVGIRDAILAAVERHGGSSRAQDDVTVVVVSREP